MSRHELWYKWNRRLSLRRCLSQRNEACQSKDSQIVVDLLKSDVNGCVTSRLFTVPGRYWKTSDVPGRRQRLLHCEYFTKHLSSNCDFLNFLLYKIHQIDFCFIFGWCKFPDWLCDTSKLPTRTNWNSKGKSPMFP